MCILEARIIRVDKVAAQGVYDHEDHPVERRSGWWSMVTVAIGRESWQQWLVRKEPSAEYIDGDWYQEVRCDQQNCRESCRAILRTLHVSRSIVREMRSRETKEGVGMTLNQGLE